MRAPGSSPRPLRAVGVGALWLCGVLAGGCDQICQGPSCEDSWPAARLLVYAPGDGDTRTSVRPSTALATLDGPAELGSGWVVAGAGGRVYVGMPESDRAVLWTPAEGDARADRAAVVWRGPWDGFGGALAPGDIDGDGREDLWVGAPDDRLERGAVVLYRNARTGGRGVEDASVVLQGGTIADRFGSDVRICADLTGDGLPETLVTAPGLSTSDADPDVPTRAGGALLVHSESLAAHTGRLPWTGEAAGASTRALGPLWWGTGRSHALGRSAACVDDLTGDGVADLVLGAPFAGDGGQVVILSGASLPASGPVQGQVLESPDPHGWFGSALATGDLDGDGLADLAVGAPGADDGHGRVRVYRGASLQQGATLPDTTFDVRGRDPLDHIGRALAIGDANGDGLDDLAVGAPDWREGQVYDAGRLGVWLGLDGGWSSVLRFDQDGFTTADHLYTSNRAFQRVGRGVVFADVDGDGADELLLPTRSRGL